MRDKGRSGLGRRWLAVALGLAALYLSGRGALAMPPIAGPAALGAWARHRPVIDWAMVAIRLLGLAAGGYLLAVLTLALAGSLVGHWPTVALAARLTPPAIRSLLALATTATLAAGVGAGLAARVAGPEASAPPIARPPVDDLLRSVSIGPAPPALRRTEPAGLPLPGPPALRRTEPAGLPLPGPPALRRTGPPFRRAPEPPGPTTSVGTGPARPGTSNDGRTLPPPADRVAGRGQPSSRSPGRPGLGPTDYVVRHGDSFWAIAAARLQDAGGNAATDPVRLARYWRQLVQANLANLPVPGDPDLLFAGDLVTLPPLPGP